MLSTIERVACFPIFPVLKYASNWPKFQISFKRWKRVSLFFEILSIKKSTRRYLFPQNNSSSSAKNLRNGPRNSNNEFRNERFRSFPNFHQSMNVIPAADLSTRPNSFPSLRVYAYPTYESPREQCSRRFGRLLGRERNRGGIDRGLKGMPIRWGAALLCPRGSAEARGVRWRERWKSPLRDWGPRFTRDCYLWGFEGDFSRLAAHSTEWLLWFADQAAFNHVRPPWNRVLRPF